MSKKKLLNLEQLKEIQEIIRPLAGITRYIYGGLLRIPKKEMGEEQFLLSKRIAIEKVSVKIELVSNKLKDYLNKAENGE